MAVSWKIKIALCAKYGATKIELVGVDTTKGREDSYGPAHGRDLDQGPLRGRQ